MHGLRETASKQRCCTRLTCRSLTAVCARLTLRARAPMLVAHRRRREKMAPGMCAPMAVRSSPCDPSSCTDLISSQTTFYLSQTRAESLVLTWSIFSTAPVKSIGESAISAHSTHSPRDHSDVSKTKHKHLAASATLTLLPRCPIAPSAQRSPSYPAARPPACRSLRRT